MASNQHIARLGVVLGIETGEYTRELNEIIQANKAMKTEAMSASKAITREMEELAFATKNYGKTLTKVEEVEQKIQRLRYTEANVGKAAIRDLLAQAAAYDAKAAAAKRAAEADRKGMGGGLNQQQIAALGYQTTDIITGLAGGQNPLLVLIQQGGQLRDQFGGVTNVFKAFGQVLTPLRVAIGASAAALGAMGYLIYKGYSDLKEFNNTLALTSNYAGVTRDSFLKLSETVANKVNISVGDSKDIFNALVSSGKFTQTSMAAVGEAIANVARLSGESADVVAKELIPSFNGSAASAYALNEKFHFLTVEQYKYIAQLEKQGKYQDAARVTAEALNESLDKQAQKAGTIAKLWVGIKDMVEAVATGIGKIGAGPSGADRIAAAEKQLRTAQALGGNDKEKIAAFQANLDRVKKEVAEEERLKLESAKKIADEQAKVNAYKKAGDINREIELEFEAKKQAIEQEANLRMVGATEFERIEIEGWKRIQESKLALERRFREVGYGLADQERKAQAAEEVRILADVEQKKAHLAKQAFDEFNKAQQLRANEVQTERERLEIYQKNIFASEEEVKLAERRLKTEQEIAKIMALEKLSPEQQEAAIEREKQIGRESEALIKQAENLKMLKGVNDAVFSSMADTIEQFMKTGKLSFKSFFSSIVAQMIHLQAQMMAMRAMTGLGNLFNLGGGEGPVELSGAVEYIGPTFADGGSPPVGVPSLVGEEGPELFIPRTAGTIIPNDKLSSFGMGQQPQVVYNGPYIASMNAIDTQSATQFLAKNKMAVWSANQSASRSIPVSR